ncbi:twin-arginine translocation pathway signal protein [Xenophilus aerolatus]|nr:twin-arginine translocation pathway signal protein [Xenophilus aerolatus]
MTRPNLLFIVADDLGYADLGCYGGRDASFGPVSPTLDGLASQGALFTQGYANSPVCSPTRFGMITARYQYRLRGAAEEPINSKTRGPGAQGLPPSHPTMPSLLRDAGYRTSLIGKWHLGFPPAYGPLASGYDEFFGPMSGGVDYFTHCDSSGRHDLYDGTEETHAEGYLTDLLSRRAVDYVDRMAQGSAPFFLSLHYTAPHWPWETREDAQRAPAVKDNLFDLAGGNIHVYRRMIHHMDEGIGWIVEALRKNGQLDNTLIVFTSDNGGERFSDNWPLVGGKMDLTEGGIRVPWIAHWPAVIAPGSQSRQLCMTMDWSATMLDAAGVAAHPDYPLDGVSLLPVLRDAGHSFERPLHWRMNHRGQRALREGDWKYLRVDGNDYLFNIPGDERERANLGKKEPERLERMRQAWEAWNASMPPIPEDATVSLGYSVKDMPQR